MEGERHDTKRQGEADGKRSAEKAMVEGRDGRTKEGRRTSGPHRPRADSACWPFRDIRKESYNKTPSPQHWARDWRALALTQAKNASYMGGLREGWIETHSNKEEATGGRNRQRMQ